MQQVALFPLTDAEIRKKAKELAAKLRHMAKLEQDKDATAKAFTEDLKRAKREALQLAKEIEEEQESREPTDDETPWQGLLDRAHERAGRRRRRDRTGEVVGAEEP